jgi:hypothetical protein
MQVGFVFCVFIVNLSIAAVGWVFPLSYNINIDQNLYRSKLSFSGLFLQHANTGHEPIFGLALACADRVRPWIRMRGPSGLRGRPHFQLNTNFNQWPLIKKYTAIDLSNHFPKGSHESAGPRWPAKANDLRSFAPGKGNKNHWHQAFGSGFISFLPYQHQRLCHEWRTYRDDNFSSIF